MSYPDLPSSDSYVRTSGDGVGWSEIAAELESFGGVLLWRNGHQRAWRVPSPTGGTFQVEVTLQRRWCRLGVDRWRTTDRDEVRSAAWFKQHVWPLVIAACATGRKSGFLPSGGGSFDFASPIERCDLLELLDAWVRQELTWGLPAKGR